MTMTVRVFIGIFHYYEEFLMMTMTMMVIIGTIKNDDKDDDKDNDGDYRDFSMLWSAVAVSGHSGASTERARAFRLDYHQDEDDCDDTYCDDCDDDEDDDFEDDDEMMILMMTMAMLDGKKSSHAILERKQQISRGRPFLTVGDDINN